EPQLHVPRDRHGPREQHPGAGDDQPGDRLRPRDELRPGVIRRRRDGPCAPHPDRERPGVAPEPVPVVPVDRVGECLGHHDERERGPLPHDPRGDRERRARRVRERIEHRRERVPDGPGGHDGERVLASRGRALPRARGPVPVVRRDASRHLTVATLIGARPRSRPALREWRAMGDAEELLTAAQKNDLAKAKAILDRNPLLLRMRTPNGTLVLTATFYGASDVLKLLLARTPEDALNLYEAATVGNARRLKTILGQSRVRVNEANKEEGFDPLGLAAFFGHPEAVKVLLEYGADVNHKPPSRFANTRSE